METQATKPARYARGLGRRKEATAEVRLTEGTGVITVNSRTLENYFPLGTMRQSVFMPLVATGMDKQLDATVKVSGGGIRGQADAVRLGIARALLVRNADFKPVLRKGGLITRDARVRERKKYGKKSARRSPQWAKR